MPCRRKFQFSRSKTRSSAIQGTSPAYTGFTIQRRDCRRNRNRGARQAIGTRPNAPARRNFRYWPKRNATISRLANALPDDVRRWREAAYRGASHVTRDLLQYWARTDRHRRLFFCQREAVETIIYLSELRFPGRSSQTGFQRFTVSDDDLKKLLAGERPSGALGETPDFFPALIDRPADENLIPLRRLGCKMATGSGKTVNMAMLVAWAFCNRGVNRESREFPRAVLVCCPNLTVKERLQVLRPEHPGNYYAGFDIVPPKYRPLLQIDKVLVTNWHGFAPESEHKDGDRNYAVVNKGPETPDVFVQRVLGKDISERLPILVLNDEGHHCWRPKADTEDGEGLTAEERQALKDEAEEARVWLDGLDRINNCGLAGGGKAGDRARGRFVGNALLHQGQQSSRGPALSMAGQRFRPGGRDRELDRQDSAFAGARYHRKAGPQIFPPL